MQVSNEPARTGNTSHFRSQFAGEPLPPRVSEDRCPRDVRSALRRWLMRRARCHDCSSSDVEVPLTLAGTPSRYRELDEGQHLGAVGCRGLAHS